MTADALTLARLRTLHQRELWSLRRIIDGINERVLVALNDERNELRRLLLRREPFLKRRSPC